MFPKANKHRRHMRHDTVPALSLLVCPGPPGARDVSSGLMSDLIAAEAVVTTQPRSLPCLAPRHISQQTGRPGCRNIRHTV